MKFGAAVLCALIISPAYSGSIERFFTASTGNVTLQHGRFEVAKEIRLAPGAHDLTISGNGAVLIAGPGFQGRALLSCHGCRHLVIHDLEIDGSRPMLVKPLPIAPTDVPFARFYRNNGILIEDAEGFTLESVAFSNIANFAAIVTHSKHIAITHVSVSASGSLNSKGRNNTSGGILIEQGSQDFTVSDSTFSQISGNAVWTHSCYGSPRNLRGRFSGNRFTEIGRDAIQVGHASHVTVSGNTGTRVGFPAALVDVENLGTPVGIDTAGDVDNSLYTDNRFEETDGKCIDLDGFHDGTVRHNVCINRGKPEDYPYGNFGIAFNNTSVGVLSRNILIEQNTLDGMKFGAIFVIGSGHKIVHNTLIHLNTAHCNETHARFGCISILAEPGFLESGIYLSAHGEKPDPATNLTIEGNTISGYKMARYCIRPAPGVAFTNDQIADNRCTDE